MFHPLACQAPLPARFNDPFDYEPHPLCRQAAQAVTDYVEREPSLRADAERGKMLGVLIVEKNGQTGFLAAYSGLLAGRNDWPFFVPPVFDAQQPDGYFKQHEREISALTAQIKDAEAQPELLAERKEQTEAIAELRQQRKEQSEALQLWLFQQYRLLNAHGERKDLVQIWRDYHTSPKIRQRFPLPPGGTGDCCAPKLLQYAYEQDLRPVQIAEFWYGASPKGEVRHHGAFYPACRGKCKPILTHMLQGLPMDETSAARDLSEALRVLYADEAIIVISKPSGLLSVRGKTTVPSVETLLAQQYGRVLMPHRLDMDTSGLMVVARTDDAYHHLQRQFLERAVSKTYVALLDLPAPDASVLPYETGQRGTIDLPLRPDPLDRPRQVVDHEGGKPAVTDYEVTGQTAEGYLRLLLRPHTGRTHQLRMHCAHQEGLGRPILGDNLYGQKAARLYLHAQDLSFVHPVTARPMHFHKEADF
jgi:tRNA pseudouridine32 synthase/23S rRNA pseudouridine746 synthase